MYIARAVAVATEVKDIPSHPLLTISKVVTGNSKELKLYTATYLSLYRNVSTRFSHKPINYKWHTAVYI